MSVTYSADILDSHIAPGVSSFTNAEIADMSAWDMESPHYVANFFLNSAVMVQWRKITASSWRSTLI